MQPNTEYPKIETLWKRDPETFKIKEPREYFRPEFDLVRPDRWVVTEKIDGTNIRILIRGPGHYQDENSHEVFRVDEPFCQIRGRTDKAQVPKHLIDVLQESFDVDDAYALFHGDDAEDQDRYDVVLYGEGYGPRVQKGGGDYRDTPGFRLFDVRVGTKWLDWSNVLDVAGNLGLQTVPEMKVGFSSAAAVTELGFPSYAATEDGGDKDSEGIVLRTDPYLYDWRGRRIVAKLKTKDFARRSRVSVHTKEEGQ